MISTEAYIRLKVAVTTTVALISSCWGAIYYMGLSQWLKQNRANSSGPTTWSEAIAFRIVMSLLRRAHLSGWRESFGRSLNQWILCQMSLKNNIWERDLSDGKTRFIWKVRMPVLYSALLLPDRRRLEVLVPLKGATDENLKDFAPGKDS